MTTITLNNLPSGRINLTLDFEITKRSFLNPYSWQATFADPESPEDDLIYVSPSEQFQTVEEAVDDLYRTFGVRP